MTAPESNPPSGDALQFDRVEPADTVAVASGPQCAGCRQSITSHYYEINGKTICENCRVGILSVFTGGSGGARFFKALFLGLLAAIVSGGVWVAIIKATGYELALVAIFVGIFVGAAVRKGSNARGGWLYQAMAVLLTYLAITGSYVPLVLEGIHKQSTAETQSLVASEAERSVISIGADGHVLLNGKSATVEESLAEVNRLKEAGGFIIYHQEGRLASEAPKSAKTIDDAIDRLEVPQVYSKDAEGTDIVSDVGLFSDSPWAYKGILIAVAFGVSLAAPFMSGAGGIIGLFILGIGLLQAWRINKRPQLSISGPHRLGGQSAFEVPPAPAGVPIATPLTSHASPIQDNPINRG